MSKDDLNKDKEVQISVEIITSKPSNFSINIPENIDPKLLTPADLDFRLDVNVSASDKKDAVKVDIELNTHLQKDGDESILGLTSTTIFSVPDYEKAEKEYPISSPNDFTRKLLNICIGGLRGALSVYLLNTELNHITLPLFDLSSLNTRD